jgi:hypothetical protein
LVSTPTIKRNDLGATSNASGGDDGGDDDAEAGAEVQVFAGIARHGDLELRVEYPLTVGELTLAKDVENFASRAP